MLRLLLDEHVPPALATQLRRQQPPIEAYSLQEWEAGSYLRVADDVLLQAAQRAGLTLLTYDQRTIVPLLKIWGAQGVVHGGVILVDDRTFNPSDIGGLLRAVVELWREQGQADWRVRIVYLRR